MKVRSATMSPSRREFLKFLGRASLATATLPFLPHLPGCTSLPPITAKTGKKLPFTPIAPTWQDDLVLTGGLKSHVIIQAGEIINSRGERFGYNNDYLAALNIRGSKDVLLWANHEYPLPVFNSGYVPGSDMPRTKEQVDKEMKVIGGSFVRLKRGQDGLYRKKLDDKLNYRIDGNTKIPFSGNHSIQGHRYALGSQGNCAGGVTPWNTILTCEEFAKAFYGERDYKTGETKYYTGKKKAKDLGWYRFYNRPPEHYLWVVEVNPWKKTAEKLVSLGRFRHECATVIVPKDGRPVVYMGEDRSGGHIFKFKSKYKNSLSKGTLYVADTKNGKWLPLDRDQNPRLKKEFKSHLEMMVHAREAAKIAGGTPHDRPEDVEIDPETGAVYISLTNDKDKGNYYGSILKIAEAGADHNAMNFTASTFMTGGHENGFACPDNFCFDTQGNFWFVTDVSERDQRKSVYKSFKNNGLFYVPMSGPDAGIAFQVGSAPVDAELTGIRVAPDNRSLLVAVQHPGARSQSTEIDKVTSRWPNGGIPNPAVVQIYGPVMDDLLGHSQKVIKS